MNHSIKIALFFCCLSVINLLGQESSSQTIKVYKNLVKLGGGKLINNTSSSDLEGPLTPPNYQVDVNNPTGIIGSYTRFFGKNLGVELLFGFPITLEIEGDAEASFVSYVGRVKVLPPTLLLNYYFFNQSYKFRPYAGLALNHTIFYNAEPSEQLENTLFGETEIELTPSTNIGGFLGINYQIHDRYFASLLAGYVKVSTTATTTTQTQFIGIPLGTTEREIDVDLNPFVFLLTFGVGF